MTCTLSAVSQSQSLAAIRNFIRVSISCITYARGLCSDDSFECRPFLGLELKHMIPTSTESITISEWIERGAFDALNKNYLKEMALCVYNADCTVLLESYGFGFAYNDKEGTRATMTFNATTTENSSSVSSLVGCSGSAGNARIGKEQAQGLKKQQQRSKEDVQRMLTSIITKLVEVVESLPPLLSERVLTMRLTYYDDVAPASYEPPCFAPASERMVKLYNDEQKYNVPIGIMDTSHHVFSVSIRHAVLSEVRAKFSRSQQQSTCERRRENRKQVISTTTVTSASSHSSGTATLVDETMEVERTIEEEEEAAAATATRPQFASRNGGKKQAMIADSPRAGVIDVANLRPIAQILSASGQRTVHEVALLLIAAFLFTKAPSAGQGRGCITTADLARYLRDTCPMDVSLDTAQAVMHRLCEEGYVQDASGMQKHKSARPQKAARRPARALGDASAASAGDTECSSALMHDSGAEAAAATATEGHVLQEEEEWVLDDPPSRVLDDLLQNSPQVLSLLSPTDVATLQGLAATLAQKEAAAQRPKMSCTESRKRRIRAN